MFAAVTIFAIDTLIPAPETATGHHRTEGTWHYDETRQMSFSMAGDTARVARQENLRTTSSLRHISHRQKKNQTSKPSVTGIKSFRSTQTSDYGRVAIPSSLHARATERHVFRLHHIII